MDEHGSVEGLVTLADVLGTVVGEPDEETEAPATGEWHLDGMMPISDFKELIGIRDELPGENEGTFHTLGGFVMMHLAKIPEPGDWFEEMNYRFEVTRMDRRRVDRVTVRRI